MLVFAVRFKGGINGSITRLVGLKSGETCADNAAVVFHTDFALFGDVR